MTEVVEELIFFIPHSSGGNSRWSNICIRRNCFFLFYLFFARHFIQNSLFAIMVMYVADFFLLSLLLISCSAHNIPSMKWEQCYDTTWIFHALPGKGVFFIFICYCLYFEIAQESPLLGSQLSCSHVLIPLSTCEQLLLPLFLH